MDKYELAVVVCNYNKNGNVYETIDAIKKTGFKNVFIEWFNDDYNWEVSQEQQLDYIRKQGLNVIFAHLGYKRVNDLWIDEDTDIVDKYKKDIKACYEHNIPMVIMHLTIKEVAPLYSEKGLNRVKEIVDYANLLNMKIAFENTKIKGYLEYVLGNITTEKAGLCFDSGHNHAHFNDELNFEFFKDRIFAVHFHDNDGTSDQHLFPFDGTINWDNVVNNLKMNGYDGPITLEIHYRGIYEKMTLEEFYQESYKRGVELQKKFIR